MSYFVLDVSEEMDEEAAAAPLRRCVSDAEELLWKQGWGASFRDKRRRANQVEVAICRF